MRGRRLHTERLRVPVPELVPARAGPPDRDPRDAQRADRRRLERPLRRDGLRREGLLRGRADAAARHDAAGRRAPVRPPGRPPLRQLLSAVGAGTVPGADEPAASGRRDVLDPARVRTARAVVADGAGRSGRRSAPTSTPVIPRRSASSRSKSSDPFDLKEDHQVLVYGYDLVGGAVTLRLYDPNQPGRDDITLRFDTGDPHPGADAGRHAGRTSGPRLLPRHVRARDASVRRSPPLSQRDAIST